MKVESLEASVMRKYDKCHKRFYLKEIKEKGLEDIKFDSWKEFEDNVVAKGFEKYSLKRF